VLEAMERIKGLTPTLSWGATLYTQIFSERILENKE
jgi:hypothetical protein